MAPISLESERLLLRRWQPTDLEPFAALNADPAVMEYFPKPLTRDESDAFVDRIEDTFEQHDLGLWAVEPRDSGGFIGYVGLWPATFDAHFTPAIEVGWRLANACWGNGYAPEAAQCALDDGFGRLGLDEIVSFTAVGNDRSRRVMTKVGLSHDEADDFDHPSVPVTSPLRRHVLYRLPAS
ncbi:MAG: GNAT family N-acetyltransferase, partial [Acidimicrobiales bacterium]